MKTTARATRYDVSALPAEHPAYELFVIRVEERGGGWWAATRGGMCLDASGRWSYERVPSARSDAWIATHRHALYNAIKLASDAIAHLRVNGHTVATVLAERTPT